MDRKLAGMGLEIIPICKSKKPLGQPHPACWEDEAFYESEVLWASTIAQKPKSTPPRKIFQNTSDQKSVKEKGGVRVPWDFSRERGPPSLPPPSSAKPKV